MSAHTPGSWTFSWDDDGFFYINEPKIVIYGYPGEIAEANARLIAAAPELLEALCDCDKAFANWQVGQIPGRPEDILALISKVRAIIAKAEGRS